jgi:ribosomal protein L32
MSVRMKLTHSKTASRRAHHRAGVPRIIHTATGVRRKHFMDTDTGMYRGKQIMTIGKAEAPAKAVKSETKKDKKVEETKLEK